MLQPCWNSIDRAARPSKRWSKHGRAFLLILSSLRGSRKYRVGNPIIGYCVNGVRVHFIQEFLSASVSEAGNQECALAAPSYDWNRILEARAQMERTERRAPYSLTQTGFQAGSRPVLDSSRASRLEREKSIGGCRRGSSNDRSTSQAGKISQIGLLILMSWLTTPLYAQLPSQSGNSPVVQSPSASDCSDPLLATTQECSGQTQQETAPLLPPQTRSLQPGESVDQSRNPSYSDSDVEQLSRQATLRGGPLPVKPLPEPLTEFQNFVLSTTGQILPIYGPGLFSSVPSTFAPLDMTPVPPDYVIGPGDELRIRVCGQVSFQNNVRVDRSGEIFLPQVGPVHVAGMPFSALDAHLRGAIGRVYHNFDLTADVGQIRAIQVYVSGEARRPGVYTVSSLSSLVDALFASGGSSVQGSMRRIQLRRGGAVVTEFDLYGLLIHGDKSKDVKLESGDVIFIPRPAPRWQLPAACAIPPSMS